MTISKEQMRKIEEFAQEKVSGLDYNHNIDHVIRTIKFAEILAKKENADLEICRVAALLHDTGQSVQEEGHEKISADMAKEFLLTLNLPKDFIENVCHVIECHSRTGIKNAKSIEAKVLYDADKFQTMGVFGFCRAFSNQVAFRGATLKQAMEKIEKYQNEEVGPLQTKTGKEMIKRPHEFMKEFFALYHKWDEVDL